MTTTPNWPNPDRPGVPMFPDRDGWHAIGLTIKQVKWWDAANKYWWDSEKRYYLTLDEVAFRVPEYRYHGPILTPTQIAEILTGKRERCAKICDEFTPDKASIADDAFLTGRYLALAGIAEKIRNLGDAS